MGRSTLKVERNGAFVVPLGAKVPIVGCQSVARGSPLSRPRSVRSQFLVMRGALCDVNCALLGCPVMEGFEPLAPPSRYLSRFRACSWIGPQKGLELALRSFLPTSHAVVTSCLLQIGRPVDPLHPRIELARSPCDIGGLLAQVPDVE